MNERKPQKNRYLPALLLGLAVLGLGSGAIAVVRGFLGNAPVAQKKVVQEIQVIRPPPPPPEEEQVRLNEPQPDPTPSDEPPPGEQLGLDADGSAGGDAFGLLGRKGGRDLLASGGSALAWYGGIIKSEILDRLQEEKAARSGSYGLSIRFWVRGDGTVERFQLAGSTGDRERDRAIQTALARIDRFQQVPPDGYVNPVTIRLSSRG